MAPHIHRSLLALAACTVCMGAGATPAPTSGAVRLVQARHSHLWRRNGLGYDECSGCGALREDSTAPDGSVL